MVGPISIDRAAWLARWDPSGAFTDEEHAALLTAARDIRRFSRGQVLLEEGAHQRAAVLILEGFACRDRLLETGAHQLLSILLPGDLYDGGSLVFGRVEHSLLALSDCRAAFLPWDALRALSDASLRLDWAIRWVKAVEGAVALEWIANIGARPADRRLAHLFCELRRRLAAVGLADDTGFELPMNQEDLGAALGLSAVHVNRTLAALAAQGLVRVRSGRVTIPYPERVEAFAGFSPDYLHLGAAQGRIAAAPRPARRSAPRRRAVALHRRQPGRPSSPTA